MIHISQKSALHVYTPLSRVVCAGGFVTGFSQSDEYERMGGQGDALGDQSYPGTAIVVSVSDLAIAEAFSVDRLLHQGRKGWRLLK